MLNVYHNIQGFQPDDQTSDEQEETFRLLSKICESFSHVTQSVFRGCDDEVTNNDEDFADANGDGIKSDEEDDYYGPGKMYMLY